MEIKEKINLIKMLSELNGIIIVNKLEGEDYSKNFQRMKEVAKTLSDEGVGEFDFSSDENFEKSLTEFLKDF